MKDNFSTQSDKYLQYRPAYPPEMIAYIVSLVKQKQTAWDCGTGNGQVASVLANDFDNVFATDISASQIANAIQHPQLTYSVQPAEQTNFSDNIFDLITVAQAIHWFNFDAFYKEVNRVAKPGAIFAAMGYGLLKTFPEADSVIENFYTNTIGKYWDAERRYIDEHYLTIPFPFKEISAPAFCHKMQWRAEHLIGYLKTWSAVKHFTTANGNNPVDLITDSIQKIWGEGEHEVRFDMLLRVGVVKS